MKREGLYHPSTIVYVYAVYYVAIFFYLSYKNQFLHNFSFSSAIEFCIHIHELNNNMILIIKIEFE